MVLWAAANARQSFSLASSLMTPVPIKFLAISSIPANLAPAGREKQALVRETIREHVFNASKTGFATHNTSTRIHVTPAPRMPRTKKYVRNV